MGGERPTPRPSSRPSPAPTTRSGRAWWPRSRAGSAISTWPRRWPPRPSRPPSSGGRVTACRRIPARGSPPPPTARRSIGCDGRRSAARSTGRRSMLRDDSPHDPIGAVEDDRLRLLFTCCHPALAMEARVALTLRMVGGLTVPEIAQRLPGAGGRDGPADHPGEGARSRPRGSPTACRTAEDLPDPGRRGARSALPRLQRGLPRLGPEEDAPIRRDLTSEAIRLTRIMRSLFPEVPAGRPGCWPTLKSATSCAATPWRRGVSWRAAARAGPRRLVDRRADRRGPRRSQGARAPAPPPQLALPAVTSSSPRSARSTPPPPTCATPTGRRSSPSTTSWRPSTRARSSPSTGRSRSPSSTDPRSALGAVERLGEALDGYHAFHATRADLLRRLGRIGRRPGGVRPGDRAGRQLRRGRRTSRGGATDSSAELGPGRLHGPAGRRFNGRFRVGFDCVTAVDATDSGMQGGPVDELLDVAVEVRVPTSSRSRSAVPPRSGWLRSDP